MNSTGNDELSAIGVASRTQSTLIMTRIRLKGIELSFAKLVPTSAQTQRYDAHGRSMACTQL